MRSHQFTRDSGRRPFGRAADDVFGPAHRSDIRPCSARRRNGKPCQRVEEPDGGNGLIFRLEVDVTHDIMAREFPVDASKACFRRQEEQCCRKPKPGLPAPRRLSLDIYRSRKAELWQ
jgi:hypothetical protein